MAKKTPLAIERDAEEIFNILHSEENSSTLLMSLSVLKNWNWFFFLQMMAKIVTKMILQVMLKKDLPISKTLEEVYYLNLLK